MTLELVFRACFSRSPLAANRSPAMSGSRIAMAQVEVGGSMSSQDNTQRLARRHVLIADDDPDVRALCTTALTRAGYQVEVAADGRDALTMLDHNDYHAVLLDLSMPFVHGATLLSILGQTKPEMLRRVLVITGASDAAIDPMIGVVGAILRKPLTIEALTRVVDQTGIGDPFDETARFAN
jgi:CheY-like chemotaxis protein